LSDDFTVCIWQDQTILLYTDSKVVAQTIDKNYTNNPDFRKYLEEIQELLPYFTLLIVQWIPESQNKGADHLARQGVAKALKLQDRR
jgi:ribonuclease HI